VSLTVGHVLVVALGTVLGASLGRLIKSRSRRLSFLNDRARAALFLVGITLAVVLGAISRATGLEKAAMVGFYIGAVYGLVASEPARRAPTRPEGEDSPSSERGPSDPVKGGSARGAGASARGGRRPRAGGRRPW